MRGTVSRRLHSVNSFNKTFLVVASPLFSGFTAVFAAMATGHDPTAGRPFPDFWGIGLFIASAICAPFAADLLASIANLSVGKLGRSPVIPNAVSMLAIAPALGLLAGAIAQTNVKRQRQQKRNFEITAAQDYEKYASQIRADPGIAIREKWYRPEYSTRAWVFDDSFDPAHINTPYSPEQLIELSKLVPRGIRIRIPHHPKCPASLIEELWPEVMKSRQSSEMEAIILNPSTPRHLLEQYMEERKAAGTDGSNWMDPIVIKRLNEMPAN